MEKGSALDRLLWSCEVLCPLFRVLEMTWSASIFPVLL